MTMRQQSLLSIFDRAVSIRKSLGCYTAARYLQKRGVQLETALWLLCGSY
jgi:hypothetical protein